MKKEIDWTDKSSSGLSIPRSSIISDRRPGQLDEHGNPKQEKRKTITSEQVKTILKEKSESLSTAVGIMELHPDLNLVDEILVAQILSPKDLSDAKFQLKVNKQKYAATVPKGLIDDLTAELDNILGLTEKMPDMLSKALFSEGACVTLMLPPANLDKLLDEGHEFTMESLDSMEANGVFKDRATMKLDKDYSRFGLDGITDNMFELHRPGLKRKARQNRLTAGIDLESFDFSNMDQALEGKRVTTAVIEEIQADDRKEAVAVNFRVPVGAGLPIHEASDPSNHVSYLFLVDEHGNFISEAKGQSYTAELLEKLKKAIHDDKSTEFEIVKSMDIFTGSELKKKSVEDFMEGYIESVTAPIEKMIEEADLMDSDINVKDYESVYKIMLARKLKQKKTRLMFVPADYVSYIAFEYNALGLGISLLEKTSYYSSIRAVLQIANMLNVINNSIPKTTLDLTLDEDDKDHMGTIEAVVHEMAKLTSLSNPIGFFNPSDIMTAMHKSSYRLNIDGGDAFPRTNVQVEDVQRSKTTIDNDLEEEFKRKQYAGMGVTPEAIDQTLAGEFATTAILNDLLAAKRAMRRQSVFRKGIEDLFQKQIRLSPKLINLIHKAGVQDIAGFVRSLELKLPVSDMSRLEQQQEGYTAYSDFIDEVMEAVISDDMLVGIADISETEYTPDTLDSAREIFASALKRQWLLDNNVLPEIWSLVDPNKELSIVPKITQHYKDVFKNLNPIIRSVLKGMNKTDAAIAKFLENAGADDEDMDETANRLGMPAPKGIKTTYSDDGSPFQDFSPQEEDDTPGVEEDDLQDSLNDSDTDGDGIPDNLDPDADGDGIDDDQQQEEDPDAAVDEDDIEVIDVPGADQ